MVLVPIGTIISADMDLFLTEAEQALVDLCRDFAQREIAVRSPAAWQAHVTIGSLPLLLFGTDDRRERWLRPRADIATELEAARWLTYRAAYRRDTGQPFLKEASMAKLKASRVAVGAASEAVQIHGGTGYMLDSPVARFYCDSKVLEIGEGTNEIQHLVVARALGC